MNSPMRVKSGVPGKSEYFLAHMMMWHPSRFTQRNWKQMVCKPFNIFDTFREEYPCLNNFWNQNRSSEQTSSYLE